MGEIYYLCNRKACGKKHDCRECRHTIRIQYAKNFEMRKDGRIYEKKKLITRICNQLQMDIIKVKSKFGKKLSLDELP